MPEPPHRLEPADVGLRITARAQKSNDELEHLAFEILDVLEGKMANTALGAAVAIDLAGASIDVSFTVEAMSHAAVNEKVAHVVEAIQPVFEPDNEVRTATAPAGSTDVALSC
jgi:hypothetical protein